MNQKNKKHLAHLSLTPQVLGFTIQLDGMLSALSNAPVLDIFHFEEKLRNKFPDWNEDTTSMAELILDKYGEEVLENIKTII